MKSYTNIEQSRKLAKILTIKSADMYFSKYDTIHAATLYSSCDSEYFKIHEFTPSWSLAALLEKIPQEIFNGEYIINITEGRDNKWILTYDHRENRNHSYPGLSSGANNLVDACYELILKLNKQNLI